MAIRYCTNCGKPVKAESGVNALDWLLIFLTVGLWILVLPFKSARCPSCGLKGTLQKLR